MSEKRHRACGPKKCNYIYKTTGDPCPRTCYKDFCSRHKQEIIERAKERGLKHYHDNKLKKIEKEPTIETGIEFDPKELYEITRKLQDNIEAQYGMILALNERVKSYI